LFDGINDEAIAELAAGRTPAHRSPLGWLEGFKLSLTRLGSCRLQLQAEKPVLRPPASTEKNGLDGLG